MSGDNFVQIVLALIAILSALITGTLMPYLKLKIAEKKLNIIRIWVKAAVKAAEQTMSDPSMGEARKAAVLSFLNDRGVDVTPAELDILIEEAVREMKEASATLDAPALKTIEPLTITI